MAGKRRPSFLKRQKEQKRTARAAEKQEARRLKKLGKTTEVEDAAGPDAVEMPVDRVEESETTEA
ncbi:MAG TPA: hypothetical protein VF363_01615, partial [Candidatus Eisenbacteria bacterium]